MTRNLRNQIKELCTGEIEFISAIGNTVNLRLPYNNAIFCCEIEGENDEELLESFMSETNLMLQNMIDHLEDCKL